MTAETGLYKVVNEFYTNDPSRRKHHVGDLVLLIECASDRDDRGLLGAVSIYSDDPYVYRVVFLANDGIVCCRRFACKTFAYFLQKTK
jgi:hypothetical protein